MLFISARTDTHRELNKQPEGLYMDKDLETRKPY